MFQYPYQTLPLKSYNLTQIEKELQMAMIDGKLIDGVTKAGTVTGIYEVPPTEKYAAQFSHPICMDRNGQQVWVVDGRPFTSVTREGAYQVRDWAQHDLQLMRAQLSKFWAEGEQSLFITLGDFPVQAFATWLSEGITRKLYLNLSEDQVVKVCAAYYYLGLFQPSTQDAYSNDNAEDRQRVFVMVARALRTTPETVESILGEAPMPTNINEFVQLIHERVDNTRIRQISVPLLYTILKSSWFTSSDQEMVCVAMEHVPTWVTLMYNGLNEKLFTRTYLSKMLLKLERNSAGKNFSRSLLTIIGNHYD